MSRMASSSQRPTATAVAASLCDSYSDKTDKNKVFLNEVSSSDGQSSSSSFFCDETSATSDNTPLSAHLTIIVTTSPIVSHPSTELIESTFSTFGPNCGESFLACKKIIVCDGYRQRIEPLKRKFTSTKAALRSGIVNDDQLQFYEEFMVRLQALADKGDFGAGFGNTTVMRCEQRMGYGFALKAALAEVSTPFVCVIQHDRTFMRRAPIVEVVNAMRENEMVKYVGLLQKSNLKYLDVAQSRHGRPILNHIIDHILQPPALVINGEVYGEKGGNTFLEKLAEHKLGKLYSQGKAKYMTGGFYDDLRNASLTSHQAALIPTLFWYDNTHICRTEHYRDFVFDPTKKFVAKGGFVEDKISPAMVATIENEGFEKGFNRFGCYLIDDHSGVPFTGHLDGGTFQTRATRTENGTEEHFKKLITN
jgi:hypothetical protein